MAKMWSVGDAVRHPRRPEWGKGVVQPGVLAPKCKILFEKVGFKIIDTSIVELVQWESALHQVGGGGEKRKYRLKPASRPAYPQTFTKEWTFEYVSLWKSLFLEGAQPRDWQAQFPALFTEKDLDRALENDGRGKAGHFGPWLCAILVWESFRLPTQILWALPRPEMNLRREQILGSKLNQEFQSLLQKHKWIDLPQLVVFREDFSKAALIMVCEEKKALTPQKIEACRACRSQLGLDVELVRLSAEKFQHIMAGHTPA